MKDKSYKNYKKIRNQIIAGVSSGIMVGMLLIGGTNSVYAETVNKTIPMYSHKKNMNTNQEKTQISRSEKKMGAKGWRKNKNLI